MSYSQRHFPNIAQTRDRRRRLQLEAPAGPSIVAQPNIAYDTLFATPPSPYAKASSGSRSAIEAWLRDTVLPQFRANVPLSRATTYYFAQSGNDSTGDGSIGNPWKTLAKAKTVINASSGNIRLRFKRGDVWRENTDLLVNKNNVTIDDYGSGDKPVWTAFTLQYSSGWTNVSGDVWERSEASTVGWVRKASEQAEGATFDPYKHEASAAACAAFPKSWYHGAGTLRVRTGGENPNSVAYEAVPMNSSGIVVTGDNVRIQNIRIHGAGITSSGLAYGMHIAHSAGSGVYEFLGENLEVAYTGYHSIGHIGGVSHRCTLVNCRFGYCKPANMTGSAYSGDCTPYVGYSPTGGLENLLVDCVCVGGALPSSGWDAQVGRQHGSSSAFQHTNDDATYQHKFSACVNLTYENNPYQIGFGCGFSGPISASDSISDVRGWVIGEVATYPGGARCGGLAGNKNVVYLNCRYVMNVDASELSYGFLWGGSGANKQKSWAINCTIEVNVVSGSSGTTVEWYVTNAGPLPVDFIAENCRWCFTGMERLGSYAVAFANTYGSRARFRNCEFTFSATNAASWSHWGTAIPSAAYLNCAYAHPNDLSGYIGSYKPSDSGAVNYTLGTTIPATAPTVSDARYGAGTNNGLEYDQNGAARSGSRFDIGPLVGV